MSRRTQGFTLVEVLVVLVIGAMVSALLFQALAQFYRLQTRFGEQLAQSQTGAMRQDWLRSLLQGLRTDFADGRQRFRGDARHLEGLSTAPLEAGSTSPRWFSLDIEDGELRYQQGEFRVVLLSTHERGRPEFAYLDESGLEHVQWPPTTGLQAASLPVSQLPAAVVLRWPGAQGMELLVGAPRSSREARVRPFVLGAAP